MRAKVRAKRHSAHDSCLVAILPVFPRASGERSFTIPETSKDSCLAGNMTLHTRDVEYLHIHWLISA